MDWGEESVGVDAPFPVLFKSQLYYKIKNWHVPTQEAAFRITQILEYSFQVLLFNKLNRRHTINYQLLEAIK